MPRRKVKKFAKAKRSTTGKTKKTFTTATGGTLEKTFKEIPAKLVAQGRKELFTLKQKEKKFLAQFKKTQAQKQAFQKQISTFTAKNKTKPTFTGKKQFATAKAGFAKTSKTFTTVDGQLKAIQDQ